MNHNIKINLDGEIEYWELESYDKIFLKYDWFTEEKEDYKILQSGISNICHSNKYLNNKFTFNTNFNIDIEINSYEQWPKVVISVFGFDIFGRNILIGTCFLYFELSNG